MNPLPDAALPPAQPAKPDNLGDPGFGPHFTDLHTGRNPLRDAISAAYRLPEAQAVQALLPLATLPKAQRQAVQALARCLAQGLRDRKTASGRAGLVQGLLQEFSLSSQEGVALMCLAEALLRIPDDATRDALIRDKISGANWRAHLGHSPSLFVNAAAWGLLLGGKLVATHSEAGLSATLGRLIARGGEPLIRKAVDMAMRLMGEQFVTGETIAQALERARPQEAQGFRYSYDMLGEAAMTTADAARYRAAYQQAIHAIGRASAGRGVLAGPGISIKLSALHPRYSRSQIGRVMGELYPTLRSLAELARGYDIGLNIDAEEADRLELSLHLLERLCFEPTLAGWNGIGFVIQAYQKRCPAVVAELIALARRSGHRLMVRLVKGAYWDSEIKHAQVDGQPGYPVFTRKAHTDVSYIACARLLLAAPDAVFPQFATHNAHTVAAIHELAGPDFHPGQYEFQCLHGMGEALYEQVVGDRLGEPLGEPLSGKLGRPCRIYAPVGSHETLLAYLVRRLLENGANTSFVNRIADLSLPLDSLVQDPVEAVLALAGPGEEPGLPHPALPLPRALFGAARVNSAGVDLSDEIRLATLAQTLAAQAERFWTAGPMLADGPAETSTESDSVLALAPAQAVRNPARWADTVGQVREATAAECDQALQAAQRHAPDWAQVPPEQRAACLRRAADALEAQMDELIGLLMREAGKTAPNAVTEVREAVDFLRYDAAEIAKDFEPADHRPLGAVVCISPWNFPLAICTGQIAAALAAGNTVLAKPAEQTPLIAAQALHCLWQAGVPRGALQLLPGRGETVGAALVADARVQGVMFTGSTPVARLLSQQLARRLNSDGQPPVLVAETGGQNAMIVDSSALVEQAVGDILASAFDSAGQRCSALRVLCVQDDVADRLLNMLRQALAETRLGDPAELATDIGPVIDTEAAQAIEAHIQRMAARGQPVFHPPVGADVLARGSFVVPAVIELHSLAELEGEVFGPVLHVLRYPRQALPELLDQIAASGYGLTMGLHTRIDETIAQVQARSTVGNLYVNRNMVGAVVGVQPFGGEGLSGTGPKAGGPLALLRLLSARPAAAARAAVLRSAAPSAGLAPPEPVFSGLLADLAYWAQASGQTELAEVCRRLHAASPAPLEITLPGPTGERNRYRIQARERILCLGGGAGLGAEAAESGDSAGILETSDADALVQLAAVLAVGGRPLWPAEREGELRHLPASVQAQLLFTDDWRASGCALGAVLIHARPPVITALAVELAERPGPLVPLIALAPGQCEVPLERLIVERSLSVNTAAAGGNASLMTLG